MMVLQFKRGLVFLLLLTAGFPAFRVQAQTTLKGTLLEAETNEPIIGATVLEVGTNNGVVVDGQGEFEITVADNASIRIQMLGFIEQKIAIRKLEDNPVIYLQTAVMTSLPIVVWAPRLVYSDQYSPTVQRLDPQALNTGDAINISEAFDGLPGVQIQQGALNTQRLSLRGIGARTPFATDQVRLYWNDIPLTNGAGESVLEDIESGFLRTAYIQTGPAPVQLGANLGGSIQLVSREWNDKNWGTGFGTSVGSFGRNRQWFNLHNRYPKYDKSSGGWSQDISLVRSHSNGYRDNNVYDRISGTVLGRIERQRSKTFYLLHLRQMDAEIPSSLNATDLIEKPTAAAFTWAAVNGREDQLTYLAGVQHFQDLGQVGAYGNTLTNRTALFAGRRTNDEVRPFNIINEDSYQYGLRSKFNLSKLNGALRGDYQVGAEFFWEDYALDIFEVLDGGAQGVGLGSREEQFFYYFAFAEWKRAWHRKLTTELSFNIRASQYSFESGNELNYDFEPFYLPGISLYYQADPKLLLHARFNRGISPTDPTAAVENLAFDRPALRPAFGWNQEVGAQIEQGRFNGRLTAFRMDLEDALVSRMDEFGAVFTTNGGSAVHQGIEAQLQQRWKITPTQELSLQSSYTLAAYRFKDFVDGSNDFSDNRIPGVPLHRWQSKLNWQGQQLQLGLTLDIADEQFVDDANTTTADGYNLLHFRVSYQLPKKGKDLQFYAGINNIFDQRYVSMVQINARGFGGALPRSFYPGQARSFYVGANYGLGRNQN